MTATTTRTSLCLKLFRAYSISFNSSNVGKFFWSWILKDGIKVHEKKNKFVVLCYRPRQNAFRKFHVACSRVTTAEKCSKNVMHVQSCCFKPIAFLPFSLPSPSSLLKLSNWQNWTENLVLSLDVWTGSIVQFCVESDVLWPLKGNLFNSTFTMALFVTVLFTAPNLEIFFILTIFRFGLCDIRNNEGLGECYQPGP